ncbi:DNA nucleotidylexotransferase-like isoform X2 [Plectropomus leopardus]|uniref:DNA nucleotidylexotransferase-like isoform X2 n=1 Tax=Plectropomus leopardus TaxID=160734 RepID=UPI001C4B95F6|nr:DNA nucleotidylexotransferase-like isoform X2 [Plectropomus leopardus]
MSVRMLVSLRNKCRISSSHSESVTHVISENNSGDEVRAWLDSQVKGQTDAQLLDISWYTESMRAGRPVDVLDRHKLQDALSLLAENAELSDEDGRGVAFRRAAAVLKALPAPVTDTRQLRGLPCLGGHSLRVIKEILENGASSEVESTKQSERFRALKVR